MDKKIQFLAAIIFGGLLSALMFIAYSVVNSLYPIERILPSNVMLIGIVVLGVVFGTRFSIRLNKKIKAKTEQLINSITPDLHDGEVIEHQWGASLFFNKEAVGGLLFITNERCFFQSHNANIQHVNITFPYDDITKIQAVKTAKIIDSGVKIFTGDKHYSFIANDSDKLVRELNERLMT